MNEVQLFNFEWEIILLPNGNHIHSNNTEENIKYIQENDVSFTYAFSI
jgi:hypothetical protein